MAQQHPFDHKAMLYVFRNQVFMVRVVKPDKIVAGPRYKGKLVVIAQKHTEYQTQSYYFHLFCYYLF